jgi:hypothetical protein
MRSFLDNHAPLVILFISVLLFFGLLGLLAVRLEDPDNRPATRKELEVLIEDAMIRACVK